MTNQSEQFYYIQATDGRLFVKPLYFDENRLRRGERIIYSTTPKSAEGYFEYRKLHESFTIVRDTAGLKFEETFAFGFRDKLNVYRRGELLCQFYFNMTGYNEDFTLCDANGVGVSLGEKGKSTVIRRFKEAIQAGHHFIFNF